MKLAIIRHGETEWNRLHKIQGQSDVPLNEHGREGARRKAAELAGENWTRCYYSPLSRTRETMEILLRGRSIPRFADPRLMEMGFGAFEGDERISETPGHPLRTLFLDPEHFRPEEGAEGFPELFKRTGDFLLKELAPLAETDEYVLLVGHGAMNLSIMNRLLGVPLSAFWDRHCGNLELVTFEIRNASELRLRDPIPGLTEES